MASRPVLLALFLLLLNRSPLLCGAFVSFGNIRRTIHPSSFFFGIKQPPIQSRSILSNFVTATEMEDEPQNESYLVLQQSQPLSLSADETQPQPPLEELEAELNRLQTQLKTQKGTYEQQLEVLEQQTRAQVVEAERALGKLQDEYAAYQHDMSKRLEAVPSLHEWKRMEREVAQWKEQMTRQEEQLAQSQAKLARNLVDRTQLQADLVLLKHQFLDQLADVEDALEKEQDGRVADQQAATKELEQLKRELQRQLVDTRAESQRLAEQMTADYEIKLAQRDEAIEESRLHLSKAQDALKEREARLTELEGERKSLRKLLWASLKLIREKLRLRRQKQKSTSK